MSVVSLLNVNVQDNPAPFNAPYKFEVTFEALEQLRSDLEFKLLYVGSATSSEHDQELDSLLVGPVPVGVNKFVFEADAPNLSRIPNSEILGVTVILLTCSYDGREFVRVGYYVNNEYNDEALRENPPAKPVIEKITRSILAEKPRVTRFAIKWDSEESAPPEFPPEQPEADQAEDDEAAYGVEDEEEEVEEEGIAGEGEDADMGGTEETRAEVKADDAASDAGSEDIENESEDDEDDEEEGEEGEGEAQDDEMDVGQEGDKPTANGDAKHDAPMVQNQQADVMVH